MSKKTDLEKPIKIVNELISEKRKEILAKRKELKVREEELKTLIDVVNELVRVDGEFVKALKRATHGGKDLREALLSSMVPTGQQLR